MGRSFVLLACTVLLGCMGGVAGWAMPARAAAPDRQADEKAIRTAAEQYVGALTAGDAQAALAFWTVDGDIVDEAGRRTTARERIEQDAAAATAAGDSSPAPADGGEVAAATPLASTTIRFLGPDIAIEDGSYDADGRFSAVWTKIEGRWRLASLREARSQSQPLADLAELDWMVGRWIGEHDGTAYEIDARWNEPRTYLERTLLATRNGTVLLRAQQRIGIDPVDGRVKSWIHDAEGGHSEGDWSRQAESWIVETRGVGADGEDLRGTSIYTPEGKKQIRWESLNNWHGGQPMLDFDVTLSQAVESGS